MKIKFTAILPCAILIASLFHANIAIGKTLKGTVTYQAVSGKKCDKTEKPITIRIDGSVANIHIGKKPDGHIKIDPATGAFKENQTNDGDVMRGTVYKGQVLKKKCTGSFATS